MASPAGRFGEVKHSPLLDHHPAAQRQADTAATPLGGEEWHKERLAVLSGDGKAIVADIK